MKLVEVKIVIPFEYNEMLKKIAKSNFRSKMAEANHVILKHIKEYCDADKFQEITFPTKKSSPTDI